MGCPFPGSRGEGSGKDLNLRVLEKKRLAARQHTLLRLSQNLNSFKGGYIGDIRGDTRFNYGL